MTPAEQAREILADRATEDPRDRFARMVGNGLINADGKLRIKHKCDRCREWKPGPKPGTSYFTDSYWYCDDCKYEQAKERGMPEVIAVLQESR